MSNDVTYHINCASCGCSFHSKSPNIDGKELCSLCERIKELEESEAGSEMQIDLAAKRIKYLESDMKDFIGSYNQMRPFQESPAARVLVTYLIRFKERLK